MSYDDGEHIKEVFAHFGLAFYLAGVFESALVNALLQADFMAEQAEKIQLHGRDAFDRAKFEAEFDAFMHRQFQKTLGNLVKHAEAATDMSAELKETIKAVKERRDFLAHHFFRERAESFAKRRGRDEMLAELKQVQALFEEADKQLSAYADSLTKKLGIAPGIIRNFVEEFIRAANEESEETPEGHPA